MRLIPSAFEISSGRKRLPPGSFYSEPAADPPFALTRDEPAVAYITGWGPTNTEYVAKP